MGPSADELDEEHEETPTLPGLGPAVASATSTAVVSPPPAPVAPASAATISAPRHRKSLLLVATFLSSVAMMFVLGWLQVTRRAPPMTHAVATPEPVRSLAHGLARTLAPSAEPEPQPEVATPAPQPRVATPAPQPHAAAPAPTHSVIPMPPPAAKIGAGASVYEPMGI